MVPLKYSNIIMLLFVCGVENYATTVTETNNSIDGIIIFSKENFQGNPTILKPGNYSTNDLPVIKSIKVPKGYEILLNKSENFDDEQDTISCPELENTVSSDVSNNLENDSNTSTPDNSESKIKADEKDNDTDTNTTDTDKSSNTNNKDTTSNNTDNDSSKTDATSNNEDIYTLDNIDSSKYKYLYVAKVDETTEDGIASHDEYDNDTGKYFGRHITNMKELDNTNKDTLKEITIDNSPGFQGLPDLTRYRELKDIKLLFNVLQEKDKTVIEKEYNKIVNYIDKVHPLRIIEMQGDLPNYQKTQNNKFFGFNLDTLPSLSNNIQEIHLINCKKLSSIDFSKYKNVTKIYMYGNTLESANTEQWKKMIEQVFNLALSNSLTHLQVPKTFTGEIPKVGNSAKSKIQYLSALGATSIAKDALISNRKLVELNLPKVKTINQGAFHDNQVLKIVNIPEVEDVVRLAFQYSHQLTKVGDVDNIKGDNGIFLPKVKTIGSGAFMANSNAQNIIITSIILPECETIADNAFVRYRRVKTISIPKCKYVGEVAFYDPYYLTELEATSVETIGPRAFQFASSPIRSFKTVNGKKELDNKLILPNCKTIQSQAFWGGRTNNIRGTSISLPECTSIADNAFQGSCAREIEAPKVKNINTIRNLLNRF